MTQQDMETRIRALEAQVRELQDDRAIREVLARYGYNADVCRDEAYVNLYTEDGVIDLGLPDKIRRYEGRAQIQEFINDPNSHKSKHYGKRLHVNGNNLVTHINGDDAVVNSYMLTYNLEGNEPAPPKMSNNQWRMRRVKGKWLIKERRRRAVGAEGFLDNLDATPE